MVAPMNNCTMTMGAINQCKIREGSAKRVGAVPVSSVMSAPDRPPGQH
ncbi:Uncharacterised protein [Mycobacterium tuberculosis]|nr:Uncharacterised protein [Mycobacterium tuberculosis]